MPPPTTEERFVRLEIQVAFQDDLIEKLNQVILEQAQRIEALERRMAALGRRVEGAQSGADESAEDDER